MHTGAKNVRAWPFSRMRSCFHIETCRPPESALSIENCRHISKMAVILAGTKSDSEGLVTYIVDIMHGKTKYSMTIYLTTTKNSATWGRACAHKSRKHTCAAVFSLARPFSHSKMHFRDLSQTEKILIKNISNCRMCFK